MVKETVHEGLYMYDAVVECTWEEFDALPGGTPIKSGNGNVVFKVRDRGDAAHHGCVFDTADGSINHISVLFALTPVCDLCLGKL